MTLNERIMSLSDKDAVRLLQQFSKGQSNSNSPVELDDTVAQQLQAEAQRLDKEMNTSTESALDSSDGDLARVALLFIASDRDHCIGLQAMLDQPKMESFAVLETAAVVAAVLIALQTHVKFERDKDGRWIAKIEKKPTDPGLLKDLIKRLLHFSK